MAATASPQHWGLGVPVGILAALPLVGQATWHLLCHFKNNMPPCPKAIYQVTVSLQDKRGRIPGISEVTGHRSKDQMWKSRIRLCPELSASRVRGLLWAGDQGAGMLGPRPCRTGSGRSVLLFLVSLSKGSFGFSNSVGLDRSKSTLPISSQGFLVTAL